MVTTNNGEGLNFLYITLVLVIIIFAGGLGGLTSFLWRKREDPESKLSESLIVGIAAAFVMPLFLSMISSDLLIRGATDALSLLVFAGFCMVAAISAKQFLTSISAKVLQQVEENKRVSLQSLKTADEAKKTAEETEKTAQLTEEKTKEALSSAEEAQSKIRIMQYAPELVSSFAPMPEGDLASFTNRDAGGSAGLEELIAQYKQIRLTKPSGPARTSEMTGLFGKMVTQAKQQSGVNVYDYLNSMDVGERLAGFACVIAHPDNIKIGPVVSAASAAEPFGQYMGIQAIRAVIGNKTLKDLPTGAVEALQGLLAKVDKTSDRHYALVSILRQLGMVE